MSAMYNHGPTKFDNQSVGGESASFALTCCSCNSRLFQSWATFCQAEQLIFGMLLQKENDRREGEFPHH